ncbi:SigE family RNA polymerase sigma factor [Streptomyces sp. NBC_00448]|uniref:SigE family RNA polymerase sigma factor n=1 Tax=Streptomyces sp. NBC_00448 TaxID=2903652 RepID=UPI002E1F90AB
MQDREFDALYAAAFPRLVRQLTLVTGDAEAAQDAVQEAFVRAWSRRGTLRAVEVPEAWVRTTAWRLAASRFRRLRRGWELTLRHHRPTSVAEPSPDRLLVERALATVPVNQRRALVLHYLCDLSVEQIAAETGTPAGTIKSWLARGRKALAQSLATEERQSSNV